MHPQMFLVCWDTFCNKIIIFFFAEALTLSFSVSASSVPSRCDELKTPPQNTNLCFFTGDSVTLSCLTEGSMTDGTIQPGNDMGTKIIRELSTTDEVFTCGASNVCGNVSSNLTLYIQGIVCRLLLNFCIRVIIIGY